MDRIDHIMNADNIFKMNLSLEKISAISAAISFWERPDVEEEIRTGFQLFDDFYYDPDELVHEGTFVSSSRELLNYIFEQFDLLTYPPKLVHQVKILIVQIGKKISSWRNYVTRHLMLDERYAETIYWTAYGQVDELKILKDCWLKDPDFRSEAKCEGCKGKRWCCIVSKYGLEDFVRNNIEEMKKYILSCLPASYERQNWTPYAIIATNIIICTSGIEHFKSYKIAADQLPADELFDICASKKFRYAAKYFWGKLSNEKQTLAQSYLFGSFCFYTGDETIFFFLFNEMAREQQTEFLILNIGIIFRILSVWPYQEMTENVLDYIPENDTDLLRTMLHYLRTDKLYLYATDKTFYLQIFQILIERLSPEAKRKVFIERQYCDGIEYLYKALNYDAVNIILVDPDLKMYRNEILDVGLKFFKLLALKGERLEDINKFIMNLKVSDEEIEPFKENFNFTYEFLIRGKINLADEHLKWQDAEFKNGIDAVKIFSILIERDKFRSANDFLRWRFDREEDRKKIKDRFKSDEFLRDKIFQIWCQSVIETDEVINRCTDLLNFFLEAEENILNFKRNKLMEDEFSIVKYWDTMLYDPHFYKFSSFLKFCLHDAEETKSRIANKINWWIDTYIDKFEMVDALLDWTFSNEGEKENVIKNYMNSPSGIELCFVIFRNCEKRYPDHLLKFFNSWIQPSFDFSKMRKHLDKWNKCDETLLRYVLCLRTLLYKRERDEIITVTDLTGYIDYDSDCYQFSIYRQNDKDEKEDESSVLSDRL